MDKLIVKEYLGNTIQFKMVEGHVYANANKMAEGFGGSDKLKNWKNSPNTQRYIEALEKVIGKNYPSQLMIVQKGNSREFEQGTWIHEKLILNFARYLNVEFELWCDEQITTLLREGKVEINQDNHSLEEKLLLDVIYSESKEETALSMKNYRDNIVKPLMIENKQLINEVSELKPQAAYCKAMLISDGLVAIGTIAKDLGFKSATELNKELHRVGVQYKTSKSSPWQLYSKYADKGYAKTIPQPSNTSKGFKTFPHLYWTEAGKKFIYELKQQGVIKTVAEKKEDVA